MKQLMSKAGAIHYISGQEPGCYFIQCPDGELKTVAVDRDTY